MLEELAGQGFVRARIDGKLHEMDALPKLDPKRKHTIEAVVDRFRVKPDSAQRLAESFETALRLSEGLARLIFLDDPTREEIVFSSRHACPVCGYSVPALEPKLFSFNSPSRRLPHLRRSRREGVLRSRARGHEPRPLARRRRDPRLGSA